MEDNIRIEDKLFLDPAIPLLGIHPTATLAYVQHKEIRKKHCQLGTG